MKQVIQNALNRKTISQAYHTSLPKFMHSQGPFAVYDHSMHKGDGTHLIAGNVNEQARQRFIRDIAGL